MPYPKKGESKKKFIKRCIPYLYYEDSGVLTSKKKKGGQSYAICNSLYKKHHIKEFSEFNVGDEVECIDNRENEYFLLKNNNYVCVDHPTGQGCYLNTRFRKYEEYDILNNRYEVGDEVVCIKPDPNNILKQGKTYKIEDIVVVDGESRLVFNPEEYDEHSYIKKNMAKWSTSRFNPVFEEDDDEEFELDYED